jgi:hypothetical protein
VEHCISKIGIKYKKQFIINRTIIYNKSSIICLFQITFKAFLLSINSFIINISDYQLMYLLFDWLELQFNSISIDKEIKNNI